MNRVEAVAYQKSLRGFADLNDWAAPHAVTLTLRQRLTLGTAAGVSLVWLTREAASQNYRHFLSLLSTSVLGKAATRFGRRVRSISVIEGGSGKRLHIHAVIDCPREDLVEQFPLMIEQAWLKTQWGFGQIDVQPDADRGWIDYISKFRDKPVYADAIDWENCHNSDCRV